MKYTERTVGRTMYYFNIMGKRHALLMGWRRGAIRMRSRLLARPICPTADASSYGKFDRDGRSSAWRTFRTSVVRVNGFAKK